jgi:hypothetical protein
MQASVDAPVVPPDPALPRLSPWLTFHLDVSNYYVILTLTILGVVEFFRFFHRLLAAGEIGLSSIQWRSEVVRVAGVPEELTGRWTYSELLRRCPTYPEGESYEVTGMRSCVLAVRNLDG